MLLENQSPVWWVGKEPVKTCVGHQLSPQRVTASAPYVSAQSRGSLLCTEGTVTTPQLQQSLGLSRELWE